MSWAWSAALLFFFAPSASAQGEPAPSDAKASPSSEEDQSPPPKPEPAARAAPLAPLEVLAGSPAASAPSTPQRPPRAVPVALRPTEAAPSGAQISREAARVVPGAFGDPTRAVEVLPGQSRILSGLPYTFVRGAPPDSTGIWFDGVRLPMLYHFGVGPAVVPASAVERVDFYPGAAPARFGRAAGAALVLEPVADPSTTEGRAEARLFDAGASVGSPFADGRGVVTVGGRYSYSAAVASLLSSQYSGAFTDYNVGVSYAVTPTDRVGVLALGAYDNLDELKAQGKEPVLTTQFHRADLRYDRTFGERHRVRIAATLGYDRSGGVNKEYVNDTSIGARIEAAHQLADSLWLSWGGDYVRDAYATENASLADENYGTFLVDRADTTFGGYVSAAFRPSPAVHVDAGVRADGYHSLKATAATIDPRGSVRVGVLPWMRLLAAGGVAHQGPGVLFPLPAVRVAGHAGGPQRSDQASVGVEADLDARFVASVVGFRHWYKNTSDFLGALTARNYIPGVFSRSDGESTGAELTVRGRLTPRLAGYLAYTLSRSDRRSLGQSFTMSFDRAHEASLVLAYEPGRSWLLSARTSVSSGVPRNDPATLGQAGQDDRLPWYYRLDLRAEKRWRVADRFPISVYFEVFNATLNREVILSKCVEAGCQSTQPIGPVVVPNVGAEILFL